MKGMRHLRGVLTQWSNRRHKRSGHLLQGRYKAILIDRDSYFLELARYIVLNPIRDVMVKHPRLWAWSSYSATIGTCPAPVWLTTDGLLAEFGKRRAGARRKYQQFIEDKMGAKSIWKDLKGQIYLGDDNFVDQMRSKLGERDEEVNIPRVHQRRAAPKPSTIRRRHQNRDDAIRAAYETGTYSYEQSRRNFDHFATVGRIVRQPMKRVSVARRRT